MLRLLSRTRRQVTLLVDPLCKVLTANLRLCPWKPRLRRLYYYRLLVLGHFLSQKRSNHPGKRRITMIYHQSLARTSMLVRRSSPLALSIHARARGPSPALNNQAMTHLAHAVPLSLLISSSCYHTSPAASRWAIAAGVP